MSSLAAKTPKRLVMPVSFRTRGDMKPLAGVAADKIVAMMADYKSGNQPATIMHQISKGYTDEQIRLIAAYFAAQKPAP